MTDEQQKVKSSIVTKVTNLSQHNITEAQLSSLEKGLKLIPSRHRVDKVKFLADLSEWERPSGWRSIFMEKIAKTH